MTAEISSTAWARASMVPWTDARRWLILTIVATAWAMIVLDAMIVNIARPTARVQI